MARPRAAPDGTAPSPPNRNTSAIRWQQDQRSSAIRSCAALRRRVSISTIRHCERSEAIQSEWGRTRGLPRRYAPRNDELKRLAGDPGDFAGDHLLHHLREAVVEPVLEHRAEHLADDRLQRPVADRRMM